MYASEADARAYYAGQNADALAVEVAMGVAANAVSDLAPPPAVADPAYDAAARLAELSVGRWWWATQGGTLASKSLSGVASRTFTKSAEVRSLVESIMGKWYVGDSGGAAANTAYVSRMPLI